MEYFRKEANEVLNSLKSQKEGLSAQEADERLLKNGKNKLAEGKKTSLIKSFLSQLADPMIYVLLAAAVVSGITSAYAGESFADVFIILFVVLLNAVLGVIQESKAEEAIAALKEMTSSTSHVWRDGKLCQIKSEDIVVGDIISLEAGDAVPADARIIECASLKAEESALTGESVPVQKNSEIIDSQEDITLGDRKNMLYMGSSVVYGRGIAVVCATGMQTEIGKIATALSDAKNESTPLQKKLESLSKILTYIVLAVSVFVFIFGVLKAGEFSKDVVINTFMLAVSLAVAAIPEGLAAVVTIVLSIGVTRMSKRNAVIRKLTAVETLGCAQIICSDKTGTLTQNKMTVMKTFSHNEQLLAKAMALCSDAEIDTDGNVVGEPTECALVHFASSINLPKYELSAIYPRIGEAPFDSIRKMMSTIHKENEHYVQYTKGAPDELLAHCSRMLTADGVKPLDDTLRSEILAQNKNMANQALRVLAAAYIEHPQLPSSFSPDKLEENMTFIGLTGMIDPVRPEVKQAVAQCRSAGIRAVMITGDHIDTAVAIARELTLLTDSSQAIEGKMLNTMSDEQLDSVIENYSVYARVQPEHKVRIVQAWKRKGKIVAMTGDGVNDAPSIKTADIGIGMGITGTDVTKNVADMILADDNFATIVHAVEEGRKIYSNIRKAIQFLLSSNLSEVAGIFTATMMGFTLLEPAHILWINLITDSLPALALGMEAGDEDSMQKPPRNNEEGIFAGGVGADIAYQGIVVAILTVCAYLIGHFMESGVWELVNSRDGVTMAFLTMSMAEIFHSFNMRSLHGSIFKIKKKNPYLWGSAILALLLTAGVIYIPFLTKAFGFTSISLLEYLTALGLAILIIPIVETVKFFQRKKLKNKN